MSKSDKSARRVEDGPVTYEIERAGDGLLTPVPGTRMEVEILAMELSKKGRPATVYEVLTLRVPVEVSAWRDGFEVRS